jgi:Zn-dependent protease
VLLVEPGKTQLDLKWRMFGFPVRVHPLFWLITAAIGWNEFTAPGGGVKYLLLWVACTFVSILVHELGHAFMGRAFGRDSHIVLYSFGGLAIGAAGLQNRWQRIAVSFAGPLAGFLLFGVVLLAVGVFAPGQFGPLVDDILSVVGLDRGMMPFGLGSPLLTRAVDYLVWINLFWGLVNLLPIWPLDGGQISHDLCTWVSPDNGTKAALSISAVVAGLFAINAAASWLLKRPLIPYLFVGDPAYTAIFFGVLAINNVFVLQQLRQHPGAGRHWGRDPDEEERLPWERDPDYWKQGRDPWQE